VIDFDMEICGKGGHAARPHLGVDAITAAAEVISAIQTVVSREIDPMVPVVVTFGIIQGGTARNVMAEKVVLQGTARTLAPGVARRLPGLIRRVAAGVCRARGARLKMSVTAGYPVLKNDPSANQMLARCYETLFGRGRIVETEPILGGEDFACYLEKVPGAMFRLGVMNKKLNADQPWHSPRFVVDDQAMVYATAVLTAAVLTCLTDRKLRR